MLEYGSTIDILSAFIYLLALAVSYPLWEYHLSLFFQFVYKDIGHYRFSVNNMSRLTPTENI
jgi:hypothetical protein